MRAIERPPRDTAAPWRPWLVRVATNLLRDRRRREKREYVGSWCADGPGSASGGSPGSHCSGPRWAGSPRSPRSPSWATARWPAPTPTWPPPAARSRRHVRPSSPSSAISSPPSWRCPSPPACGDRPAGSSPHACSTRGDTLGTDPRATQPARVIGLVEPVPCCSSTARPTRPSDRRRPSPGRAGRAVRRALGRPRRRAQRRACGGRAGL